jgi:hypothetical protein
MGGFLKNITKVGKRPWQPELLYKLHTYQQQYSCKKAFTLPEENKFSSACIGFESQEGYRLLDSASGSNLAAVVVTL